jgi:hypothetical protein
VKLIDVIPTAEICERFPDGLKTTTLDYSQFGDICAADAATLSGSALNVWNRIVQRRLKPVDPMALGPYIDFDNAYLYKEIEKLIQEPVINDAAYFHAEFKGQTVANVVLLSVFPNSLHLADVNFVDPAKPISISERKRFQSYRGFALLPKLISNMSGFAAEKGLDFLTLTAAYTGLIPVFERHGFSVEKNPMADLCVKSGECIPMEKTVRALSTVNS